MKWIWQLREWPNFRYEPSRIAAQERQFLLKVGNTSGFLRSVGEAEYKQLAVEILSSEGLESSKIEGELLDRESLQSSIKRHFGLTSPRKERPQESQVARLMLDVYENFEEPLTHELLWNWHATLFSEPTHIADRGQYRTHSEPMQIVSNRYGSQRIFFEAPPSTRVKKEMTSFVRWFNQSASMPILERAAIAHLRFEVIHPFEDGNGRVGRLLVEKILSQGVGRPVLIAVSKVLQRHKKQYYSALESCNYSLHVDSWLDFFAGAVLEAQDDSSRLLEFLVAKARVLVQFKAQLNERQEKALVRMFEEGPSGFKGGLSAENYLAITKTSRATATRDLAELVEMGIFARTGSLRHTRYHFKFG